MKPPRNRRRGRGQLTKRTKLHVSRRWLAVGGWYPPIQRRDGEAEVFHDVGGWGSVARSFLAEAILLSVMRRFRSGRRGLSSNGTGTSAKAWCAACYAVCGFQPTPQTHPRASPPRPRAVVASGDGQLRGGDRHPQTHQIHITACNQLTCPDGIPGIKGCWIDF